MNINLCIISRNISDQSKASTWEVSNVTTVTIRVGFCPSKTGFVQGSGQNLVLTG